MTALAHIAYVVSALGLAIGAPIAFCAWAITRHQEDQ